MSAFTEGLIIAVVTLLGLCAGLSLLRALWKLVKVLFYLGLYTAPVIFGLVFLPCGAWTFIPSVLFGIGYYILLAKIKKARENRVAN